MTDTLSAEYAILYVDDEEMALKYFRRFVGRDFTVHTATNVDDALEVLAQQGESIGVLITDQRMPGQSGVDLLKKVRSRWPHIVRLLTTAYADLEDAIEAVNRGEIFRYLTKPWDTQTLLTELRQAMEMFTLRHERAILMREKMSVWQRLIQLGRLRDLLVMAHSLRGLRNSEHAVVAYLEDHLMAGDTVMAGTEQLDLWQVTEDEIGRSLAVVMTVREAIDALGEFGERDFQAISVGVLAEQAATEGLDLALTQDNLPEVSLDERAIEPLCRALSAVVADHEASTSLAVSAADGGVAFIWTRTASAGLPESSALLIVYLVAHHHGGALTCRSAGDAREYRLFLPTDGTAAAAAPLAHGWLESLLVRLEGWDQMA